MNNTERNCDTCNDSYYMTEKNPSGGKKLVQLQHCRNTVYNSPAYTHQMLLEDWGKGFCRLWTPITEKGNEHEQQLYHRPAQCPCGEVSLVHRYRDPEEPPSHEGQLEYDDVYQQLALRLIRAVAGFDPQKGTLQQHIFAQLKYELLNCKSAYRLCGLTGAPKEYRKSDMVSLDHISEGSSLYEQVMAA